MNDSHKFNNNAAVHTEGGDGILFATAAMQFTFTARTHISN